MLDVVFQCASAPITFNSLVDIEKGLFECVGFRDYANVMSPWYKFKYLGHFQKADRLLAFLLFIISHEKADRLICVGGRRGVSWRRGMPRLYNDE